MLLIVGFLGAGCARDPLPEYCPVVEPGELVISELRFDQEGSDSFGHYIELYNAAGSAVDLRGLVLRLRSSSGDELELFVRDELDIGPGEYLVIGPGDPEAPDPWIDYAVGWDISGGDPAEDRYPDDLLRFSAAFIEIEACGRIIDQTYYDLAALTGDPGIKPEGTLACGNADSPPSADANDDIPGKDNDSCWCIDAMEADPDQPLFGVGLPGSPGRPNRCP
ncbi:MAG: lamin tail domain-containing protein [Myxococcales bacterium]|nr:lamin tail domain-containing protein [Myxococcales bacterium]